MLPLDHFKQFLYIFCGSFIIPQVINQVLSMQSFVILSSRNVAISIRFYGSTICAFEQIVGIFSTVIFKILVLFCLEAT
jgi:hypothetical protein